MSGEKMKVLMLTPSYDPIIGGTETVVKNLAINLNKIGVKTDVMTFNMDKKWHPIWKWEIKEEGMFKIYRVPAINCLRRNILYILSMFRIHVIPNLSFRRILKSYDILHFHDDVDLTFPLFSLFINKPKIFHCHTIQDTFRFYTKNIVCRHIFKKVAEVYIANSTSTAKFLGKLDIANARIKLLPNGVDINKFKPRNGKIDNLVLFVGRFQERKGLHVLLESLKFLEHPINLVLIGPHSNDKYSKKIFYQIKEINRKSKHRVLYLGPLDLNSLIEYYQKASIFVCPSLIEPFGVVNVEALACGTPVVASNVDGIPDIVENNRNGILVSPNDPFKLAEAIDYLLDNEDVRTKFGRAGRKKVEKEFSWNVIAKKLSKIYTEVI